MLLRVGQACVASNHALPFSPFLADEGASAS
jgi:hypothetical protein